MNNVNVAKKVEQLTAQQREEFLQMEQLIKEAEARQKAILGTVFDVKCKAYTTQAGKTGITVHGLGKSQFFYKSHLLALVGEGADSEKVRQSIREWITANDAVLSNAEE